MVGSGEEKRTFPIGKPSHIGTDNSISTSKYTIWNFFFIAFKEQFRRNGNLYFLVMGLIMFMGTYTDIFESSVIPWTTLGPLAIVLSVSVAQEGAADLKRHKSDHETNCHPCVILRRVDDVTEDSKRDVTIMEGKDVEVSLRSTLNRRSKDARKALKKSKTDAGKIVKVAFQIVKRMNIRAGDIVLVKNREMIPADIILLGSSGENGVAYIETSPIDGETNLKLRSSPQLPIDVTASMNTPRVSDLQVGNNVDMEYAHPKFESIERSVKRITRFSLLGFPEGVSSLRNPYNPNVDHQVNNQKSPRSTRNMSMNFTSRKSLSATFDDESPITDSTKFVTALTSEQPNASVNTFTGKITLPPIRSETPSIDIPLGAENILLRGAFLRNTEWVIGVACFTGADTKLARNSIKTPSKFSRLDELMNKTVILILVIMMTCVTCLAIFAYISHIQHFDSLWYARYNENGNEKWPYLPDLDAPKWVQKPPAFHQFFFTYITLLNNFVPLSLYVTVEAITLFMMYLINWDLDMYHRETDTPAVARSTTVTDLGQVKYVFSDKTGTLTQNVMNFKRCSVDGSVFGAPIKKSAPGASAEQTMLGEIEAVDQPFHPLKRLMVGAVSLTRIDEQEDEDEESHDVCNDDEVSNSVDASKGLLTFNAEMFLRVMSVCHTVVVEEEHDGTNINASSHSGTGDTLSNGLGFLRVFNRSRNNTEEETRKNALGTVNETADYDSAKTPFTLSKVGGEVEVDNTTTRSALTAASASTAKLAKSGDGSPFGFAYQAESPDEGALVSAASLEYGFQLISRDSEGVKLSCSKPSLLAVNEIAQGIKHGQISASELASETATPTLGQNKSGLKNVLAKWEKNIAPGYTHSIEETWAVLAVNKFDSDRKRMSVVVRSPPHLGSIPMLLCKGADSSMLDPLVCEGGDYFMPEEGVSESISGNLAPSLSTLDEDGQNERNDWTSNILLNLQSHLGTFATEGLRTLVLGIRILTESECEDWLARYHKASTAIDNRESLLTDVAKEIETNIHIVGATAIEDQLQDGVPEAIESIGKAGIKLWVLTGDKRETAIEIGYSTRVLNPKMHLTDVADGDPKRVKALVAMEFLRLVKMGKLPQYQRVAIEKPTKRSFFASLVSFFSVLGRCARSCSRAIRRIYHAYIKTFGGLILKKSSSIALEKIVDEVKREEANRAKHKQVRDLAERLISEYLESEDGQKELRYRNRRSSENIDFDGGGESLPAVFNRASSARASLGAQMGGSQSALREISLASVTADSISTRRAAVVDEDTLSLHSFVPGASGNVGEVFNRKKRTLLEKMFAVDRDVRKGKLVKHLTKQKKEEYYSSFKILPQNSEKDGPDHIDAEIDRGFVIEGSALAHFLDREDEPLLEELLFCVASNCESVIACRVSPKQKALLVKLAKHFVQPTPVTLAIGDGANDVGMIQEAQVGVGISGLEGQQAVNSSDFAIAQFRYLQNLLLTHGRWNFMRLSKVVLFSFYKNAVLAALLMIYSRAALYSGIPLFDQWALSAFNFVCGWPIIFLGMFDRDLSNEYVRDHPHLYAAGINNEYMAMRTTVRWMILVVVHANLIYFFCASSLSGGGVQSSAFKGQMHGTDDDVGDGDGGGIKIFGTTIFLVLNWVLALKVLFESGAIIHGRWLPFKCCVKDAVEGFWSRTAYTWHGVIFLSIAFNFFFLYTYQLIGEDGASSFSSFVHVTYHLLHTRVTTWLAVLLATTAATMSDVIGKVFSNMFYPTQTQVHKEVEILKHKKNNTEEETLFELGETSGVV